MKAITSTTQQIVMKTLPLSRYLNNLGRLSLPKLLFFSILALLIFNKDLDIRFQFNPGLASNLPATEPVSDSAVPDNRPHASLDISLPAITAWIKQYLPMGSLETDNRPQQLNPAQIEEFVKRYSNIAIAERRKYGVPSSVLMAAALLLSDAGTAVPAKEANNLFSLPCTDDWQGTTLRMGERCLRQYDQPWTSFRDFSFFLTTGKHFRLREIPSSDYKAWAGAIGDMNFHGTPGLGQQMEQLIQKYNLYILDQD